MSELQRSEWTRTFFRPAAHAGLNALVHHTDYQDLMAVIVNLDEGRPAGVPGYVVGASTWYAVGGLRVGVREYHNPNRLYVTGIEDAFEERRL